MADIVVDRITHIKIISRPKTDPSNPVTIYNDLTQGIESGSMTLTEILLDGDMEIGQVNSNMFEVTIHDITDVTGHEISVWSTDSNNENKKQLFTGYVDKCVYQTCGNAYQLTAYDYIAYLNNKDVADIFKSTCNDYLELLKLDEKYKYIDFIKDFLNNVFTEYGLSIIIPDKFTTGHFSDFDISYDIVWDLRKYCPSSITFNEILRQIGESECGFIQIDRNGEIVFIGLGEITTKLKSNFNISVVNNYETGDTQFSENTYKPPKTVNIFNRDGTLIDTYTVTKDIAVSSGHNVKEFSGEYNISDNFFMQVWYNAFGGSSGAWAQLILELFAKFDYQSGDIKLIVSNFDIQLGNVVALSYDDNITSKSIVCPVFQNTYSGSLLVEQTVSAQALNFGQTNVSTETQNTQESVSLSEKTENLQETVSNLSSTISDLSTLLDAQGSKLDKFLERGDITNDNQRPVWGGGTGNQDDSSNHNISIGWTGTKLNAYVDNTDMGNIYTDKQVIPVAHGGTGAETAVAALNNLGGASRQRITLSGSSSVSITVQSYSSGIIVLTGTTSENIFGAWLLYGNSNTACIYTIHSSTQITVSCSGETVTFTNSSTSNRYINIIFAYGGTTS